MSDRHDSQIQDPGPTAGGGSVGRDRVAARPGHLGVSSSALGVAEIVGGLLWAIGVSIVGIIVLSLFEPSLTDPDLTQPDGVKLAVQAFAVLGFVSAALGMTMIANRSGIVEAAVRLGMRGGRHLGGSFGLALLAYFIVAALIASLLSPNQEDIAENLGADKGAALIVIVVAGLLIVPGAAIGEELFFRGLLFGGLRQRLSLWPAAAISGVLFGLPHLPQGDLAVGLQLSLLGVVLAWAYDRSGSLWVPIALHGLNNALAFYFLVTDKF